MGADAIAVGGGLAGAAFALELARNGARVVLVERSPAPMLKVCGDFLSGEAIGLLAYLGLDVGRLGAKPVRILGLACGRSEAEIALPFDAVGVARLKLDEALLASAADAGAEIVRGARATGLHPDGAVSRVETDRGRFRARSVALATGKHNLRGWQRSAGTVTGFKISLAMTPAARARLEGRVQLVLFAGGHVGACMINGEVATLCWQIESDRLKALGADWREHLAFFARQSPLVGELLSGAEATSPRPATVSSLPFGYVRREAIGEAVYPLGDQIAVIPSFTGDGTAIALASGIMAARTVLAGGSAPDYQRAFLGGLGRQFALAKAISRTFRSGIMRQISVRTASWLPAIATGVARATRLRMATRL